MKVLVTGGTGFVGSHVVRNLLASGQSVRLLVRDVDRATAMGTSAGWVVEGSDPVPSIEFVQGDITDPVSVSAAIAGCDALVHAAAGTPIRTRSVDEMFAVNVGGVKHVVTSALAQGVERIVVVSSITAIFNADASKVTADAPPARSNMPYGKSKVEAEHYLRALQDEGAPIAIVYPGGVIGPDDPGFSDTCMALKHRIENGFRIFGQGGMQHVDVRDLAAFIDSLVTQGGTGRFLLPGVYLTWTELADTIERVSGCTLQRIPAQGWKLRMMGRLIDVVRKFRTVDAPISAETMRYATLWPNIANTDELHARNLLLRDPADTFADTLRWMVRAGHLEPQRCPQLQ
jgi:nucleoside-diphosphate-sugar epimerase